MTLSTILTLLGILFGSGGIAAGLIWIRKQGKDDVTEEINQRRADVAEKRLEIANEPDPSVDDVVVWLSDKRQP